MKREQIKELPGGFAGTAIFVTDALGRDSAPLGHWLQEAGATDVISIASLDALPTELRHRQRHSNGQPALAIITARTLTDELLTHCLHFRRLVEEGWLGIVVLLHDAPPPQDLTQEPYAGCIDIMHVPEQLPGEDAHARLLLALSLLRERHLRLAREQMFRTQLADRRVMEARLNYIATHDELTDLANRAALEKALGEAIALGKRRHITNALLYLDLDRFKLHNDAAGHGAGDALLQVVGNRLRGALPPEYLLARLGSDEFAVLLQGVDEQEAHALAEQLRATIADIEPDGVQVVYHVGISIGLTLIRPGAITSASQALAQAEQASYVAKTRGGNAVHRFSHEDAALESLREDMRWASPIRQALIENRFFLAFQPILSVADDTIAHYEALIRIPTTLGGDGNSARFMAAAERLGLAQQIDLWVVNNAIDFLAERQELSLGVNLSSHAFQEPALLPLLHHKLSRSAIAPQQLTFEITETAAVMNFAETRRMIGQIRDLGCRFALDDFGSGFSTYNYIKQFPIDMLKIDGSFIVGLREDAMDRAIVKSMIDIGHSLEKDVVAEFIDDAETFRLLTEMGIDHAQGYYIGRPTLNPTRRKRGQPQ